MTAKSLCAPAPIPSPQPGPTPKPIAAVARTDLVKQNHIQPF